MTIATTEEIKIRNAPGTWVIRAGGAVLGETANALSVTEGNRPEVIYFPRGDVAMAFIDQSGTVTDCPQRGQATWYSIVTRSGDIRDAGWSYETPGPGFERIAGYMAFHATDNVHIEQV